MTPLPGAELRELAISSLAGFEEDDLSLAWACFLQTCVTTARESRPLRDATAANAAFKAVCNDALNCPRMNHSEIAQFLATRFQPFEIIPGSSSSRLAFFTGYYEPVVAGALEYHPQYTEPLYAKPIDLIAGPLPANAALPSGFSAGRKGGDGKIEIYPDRRAIDLGALDGKSHPIAWVRDGIEAFMIHVQGSAVIKLASGDIVRLTYAGRNGHPYTSIGNILIDCGEVPLSEMSLAKLKKWVRDNGQQVGEKGRQLLQCNASYIFFTLDKSTGRATGPIGGAGVPLTPLRSIAVDRTVWPYGLPFWIDVRIPWPIEGGSERHIRQLMIAQDTGSAILGSARADIFVGAGDEAGEIAGRIRHNGRMIVFLPRAI